MTCFNKEHYKTLKKAAKTAGDVFVTARVQEYSNYNGVAIAVQPSIENTNGKMLNVAVSYCSIEDTFKPKHGKYQALLKLANGEVVQMPLADFLREYGADHTLDMLLSTFSI